MSNIETTIDKDLISLAPYNLFSGDKNGTSSLKLTPAVRDGFPRFTLFLNSDDPSVSIYDRMITVAFTPNTFNTFMELAKKVITSSKAMCVKRNGYNNEWVNNARTENVILQSTISICKDEDGLCYFEVNSGKENSVNHRFNIVTSDRYDTFEEDGVNITKSRGKYLADAMGYIRGLTSAMDEYVNIDIRKKHNKKIR